MEVKTWRNSAGPTNLKPCICLCGKCWLRQSKEKRWGKHKKRHPTVLVVVKVKCGKCALDVLLGELSRYLGLFNGHALWHDCVGWTGKVSPSGRGGSRIVCRCLGSGKIDSTMRRRIFLKKVIKTSQATWAFLRPPLVRHRALFATPTRWKNAFCGKMTEYK